MTYTPPPVVLERNERYGSLTVLSRTTGGKRGKKYRCGCSCGNSKFYAKATKLMRVEVKDCGCGASGR